MSREPGRRQAEGIVDVALGLPQQQRQRYLEQACGEDPQLSLLVGGMLKAHERAAMVLAREADPEIDNINAMPLGLWEMPGDQLGRYKLLSQIGEGGCGVVYLAEQQKPVKRRVAL